MNRRQRIVVLVVAVVAVAVSLVLLVTPVNSTLIRISQLAALAVGAAAALSLVWRWRWARVTAVVIAATPLTLLLAPGRPVDEASLREAYVSELTEMVGVRYVWGGEGRAGIDCSGLPRKALLDASIKRGLATANPALLRRAVGIWWNDVSARAIGSRYRRSTVAVTSGEAIRTLDVSPMAAGDLAVTKDGQHLLVFLGDDRWIQADPTAGKVITVGPADDNSWLQLPVNVVRWRTLAG